MKRTSKHFSTAVPLWSWFLPVLALGVLGLAVSDKLQGYGLVICMPALLAGVIAAVHHAEVIAQRVGEPFGTLVLAIAVTVIEVALILAIMLTDRAGSETILRDTVFATIMIVCNGAVGSCLLLGGLRHREQAFHIEGANSGLSTLIALATLTLVLPNFTSSSHGPTYSPEQLIFAAAASLVLWASFVFMQTVGYRDYFLPVGADEIHARPPSRAAAWASFFLMLPSLVAVVGLAKVISPSIESALTALNAPRAVLGIVIALIVLLPETTAAIRASRANRLQTSLNLAFGSAIASIGLSIPVIAGTTLYLGRSLVLGIDAKELVLLVLTFAIASITLVSGRTHAMHGIVHLTIFSAFVFLACVP